MSLMLYTFPGTCGFASHAALAAADADYNINWVDFRGDAQRQADYLAINPKGRVPALVTDRGILTETPAILAFIAQSHPDANLAPLADPFEFARVQSVNAYLCATVHVAHAHKYRGYRWASDESSFADMRSNVPRTMGECFALIENELLAGPWVLGDRFSISDLYLLTIARWLEADEVDLAPLPRVLAHRERALALPAVQRALQEEASIG